MPTFCEEVEGAYELIEGALSQVTVNGVAVCYVDRLPKIAVAGRENTEIAIDLELY